MKKQSIELSDINFPEYNHSFEEVKKCPKCSSVFIGKESCDSCNYQFSYSTLGAPLDEKSFYTLRENYWETLGYFTRTYSFLEKKGESFLTYKRAAIHRFEVLIDFFLNGEKEEGEVYSLYFKELKDIVYELVSLGVSEKLIWKKFDALEDNNKSSQISIYQQVSLIIEEARSSLDFSSRPRIQRLFDYKIAGGLRVGVLMLLLASSLIIIILAISFYKYLNIYNI